MQGSRELIKNHKKPQTTKCKTFCCTRRISVSSYEEGESSNNSNISHSMVQERLDQIIRERKEARNEKGYRKGKREKTKFVVMVAMEKSSYDPRVDFRKSMEEMIVANRILEIKDLRRLLNYYVKMNSEELRGVILEVFYEVCIDLFVYCNM
ncbi:hypothetical protein CDL12_21138 [Handroanthus impetiginosus]|uniref:Transcription repressor n=1 Tax=Handroanthus impetiginosus TaxID=429701 RepID=A0A2G9GLY3_9LAMI|nr:hypothetical protein CDL12_21138 [Handroanthus impetiginosus]